MTPRAPELSRRRARVITAALLVGTFLASIEATVVGAAMPTIAGRLGGLALYPWVFSAYLLAQTITIPLYGRLADLYGRRATYVGGVGLFLVGSVLCGAAPSMHALVAARAIQGLGAGAVLPVTMTIFGDLYDVSARTKLQGLFSLVWGVSSVAGPLAGGAIVQSFSWRWIFLLNLPFGLVSAALVGLLLCQATPPRRHKLDLVGAASLAVATLLVLVSTLPADQRPAALPPWVWVGAGLLVGAGFVWQERRHAEPLVPLDLYAHRVHQAVGITGLLLGMVLFGAVSYMPLYVQAALGGSPIEAGAALIPLSLAWTTASIGGGRIVRRVGFRSLVRAGCLLVGAGGVVAVIGIRVDLPALALSGTVLFGLGMGLSISSFTVSVQEEAPPTQRGIATALSQFSRSIGGALGVAALGAVLASTAGLDGGAAASAVEAGTTPGLARGLELVFVIVGALAVAAAAVGIALFPRIGSARDHADR